MSDFKVAAVSSAASGNNIQASGQIRVLVVGVGGGGCNALQHMINQSVAGVEFIAVNTDSVALARCTAPTKVQIGVNLTQGLGAGCNPNIGRKAAEESREDIKRLLQGADMVFITAGMGGGTGTGAAPLIAEISKKECQKLTVAVVTKPFKFEGKRHAVNALAGISDLSKHVDSLIVVDNNKLLSNLGANVSIINAFNAANDVLYRAVFGVVDIINNADYINVDFNDVRTAMLNKGMAVIGIGRGKGPTFVEDALTQAIRNPLVEDVDIKSATGLLVHSRVSPNFSIARWQEIQEAIQNYVSDESDAASKTGMSFDESLEEDEIIVTIIMTGISSQPLSSTEQSAAAARAQSAARRQGNALPQDQGGFFSLSQGHQLSAVFGAKASSAAQPAPGQSAVAAPAAVPAGTGPALQSDPASSATPAAGAFFAGGLTAAAASQGGFAPAAAFGRPHEQDESGMAAPSGAQGFVAPSADSEIRFDSPLQGTADEGADLWEVPPILRNRAD